MHCFPLLRSAVVPPSQTKLLLSSAGYPLVFLFHAGNFVSGNMFVLGRVVKVCFFGCGILLYYPVILPLGAHTGMALLFPYPFPSLTF